MPEIKLYNDNCIVAMNKVADKSINEQELRAKIEEKVKQEYIFVLQLLLL